MNVTTQGTRGMLMRGLAQRAFSFNGFALKRLGTVAAQRRGARRASVSAAPGWGADAYLASAYSECIYDR